MPTYRAKVDHSGKVQVPEALVRKLGIEPGDEVEFFESADGEIFFHALVGTATGWSGLFAGPERRPPPSIREMDEGIAEHLADKNDRIVRQWTEADAGPSRSRPAAE